MNKEKIIKYNEVGFSNIFKNYGYSLEAKFAYLDLKNLTIKEKSFGYDLMQKGFNVNSTHHFIKILITKLDFPFLKIELLNKNPSDVPDLDEIQLF